MGFDSDINPNRYMLYFFFFPYFWLEELAPLRFLFLMSLIFSLIVFGRGGFPDLFTIDAIFSLHF